MSCAAIVVAARRVSRLRLVAQREDDEVDLFEAYDVGKGDPAAEASLDQRKARHLLRTGRPWGVDPPSRTQAEFLREELALPAVLALAGVAISTAAGAASLFV